MKAKWAYPLNLAAMAAACCLAVAAPPKPLKCQLEQLKDSQSGLVAFTYLVPNGWVAHNRMGWNGPGSFVANLSAATPDKHYSVSQLERMVTTYSLSRASTSGTPIHHATDFLKAMVEMLKQGYGISSVEVVDDINSPLAVDEQQLIGQGQP